MQLEGLSFMMLMVWTIVYTIPLLIALMEIITKLIFKMEAGLMMRNQDISQGCMWVLPLFPTHKLILMSVPFASTINI